MQISSETKRVWQLDESFHFIFYEQVDLSPGGSSSGNKIGVISSSHRVGSLC
jgi:hypothetical protein